MDHTINSVYCTDEFPNKYPNTRGKIGLIIAAVGIVYPQVLAALELLLM